MKVTGKTFDGVVFRGELVEIDNGYLHLRSDHDRSIGIQTEKIETLEPAAGTNIPGSAQRILQLKEILHTWKVPVQWQLVGFIESLAEDRNWSASYQAASRMETASGNPQIVSASREIKAWSLFGLGLVEQCAAVLKETDYYEFPLKASTRTCQMLAHIAKHNGDLEQALFWALVPTIRVPVDDSPLAGQLLATSRSWKESKT